MWLQATTGVVDDLILTTDTSTTTGGMADEVTKSNSMASLATEAKIGDSSL
jgi:hypothetical protein